MSSFTLHYHRPGPRGLTLYTEDLIEQTATRIITYKALPETVRHELAHAFWRDGLVAPPRVPGFIRKYYFHGEPFTILAFLDTDAQLIAHYSDIVLPLEIRGDEFHMTDLFLDFWIEPNGTFRELDWNEFDEAIQLGLITTAQEQHARAAMERIRAEIQQGMFPQHYIQPS